MPDEREDLLQFSWESEVFHYMHELSEHSLKFTQEEYARNETGN